MADTMAASSGGVEWSSIIKPILSQRYDNANRKEILDFCSTIIKCEADILRHKENNKKFYDNFVVLSADYISTCVTKLSVSQVDTISAACRVLLKYLLNSIKSITCDANSTTEQVEIYLNAVQVLCIGTSPLSTAEIQLLVNTMKGENLPQQPNTPPGSEKDAPNKQESPKTRSDLSMDIFEQLTLPLRDGHTTTAESAIEQTELPTTSDPITELNKLFLKTNTESLQALRAGDTLVDLCLNLQTIKKARAKIEDTLAGKPFNVPTNQSEANLIKSSINGNITDLRLAFSAINLPVLEPLTPTKLDKLSILSMAVLQCAISHCSATALLTTQSSSSSTLVSPKCQPQHSVATLKEDEFDQQAVQLVEESLKIYSFIGTTIKNSTRAGGHVYQNHLLAGAWVLISGLQAHLTASTTSSEKVLEKGRSPCKGGATACGGGSRTGLQKFQQSFGVLSVAIATKVLALLTELFDDLHLEACGGNGGVGTVEPAPLAIMGQFTALQRVARVMAAAPLNNFLFYLAIVSYGKACSLKRLDPPDGDTFSQSDSTTYYEDMILVSDESSIEDDDDSEPILGQWFEETLAPVDGGESKASSSSDNLDTKSSGDGGGGGGAEALIPEKGEANGYLQLATGIFVFMNRHFLCTKSGFVSRYVKNGLSEQQMLILAAIIRDLDRETARCDSGTISGYFGAVLGQLYCDFSGALTRYTHNLITNANLSGLQACLLNHLGVSPWNTDIPHGWPLQVYPRTLAVLSQVLLLRAQNEKEASVISIWHRLVNTLIENVLNSTNLETEDLNVEHAQVLLYLFHSLNLMQKKSVLLLLAGGLLRCSEVARGSLKDWQLLHLSRLLLLFDYIMKHLYDAPTALLEQIQWNLFYSTHLNVHEKDADSTTRKYIPWADIEDNYRKIPSIDVTIKPRFYQLTNLEINNQDTPKLDGLACNFILGTPDKLRYPLLLDALIEILNVTNNTSGQNANKMSFLGLCSTQYCFTICWRLLQLLPPSVPYMERLASTEILPPGPTLLHSLIWGPRIALKNFNRWVKDSLVKQGLYTQHSDKLLKTVQDSVNNLKYDVTNAKNCILALTPELKNTKDALPPLWHLCLLDCLLAKVQVGLLDAGGENNSDEVLNNVSAIVQDSFPHVLKLTNAILYSTRWSLVWTMVEQSDCAPNVTEQNMEALEDVLCITSTKNCLISTLAGELGGLWPAAVLQVQQQWNGYTFDDYSSTISSDSEAYLMKIVESHISTLSLHHPFTINPSLRRFLQTCIRFLCDHAPKIENTDTKNKAIELLVSTTLDSRMEYLQEIVSKTLDKMIGDTETDEHQKRVYLHVLHHTYRLIINYTNDLGSSGFNLNEQVLHNCLRFYEKILEKSAGRQALEHFFTSDKDLVKVLMSVSSPQMSQQYSTRVLQFFNKLFQAAEKSSTDPSLNYLCGSMSKLANVEPEKLQAWLHQIIIGNKETNKDQLALIQENSQLLQALTCFIVKQNSNVSEEVALTILKALIPLGGQILSSEMRGLGFVDLMVVMTMLADAGSGRGHQLLFPATSDWILATNCFICEKEECLNSERDTKIQNDVMFEAGCSILDYISDVVNGIVGGYQRPLSPPWEGENPLDCDVDWGEEPENDEESGEESDEDSLGSKLCTFTVTQKEFMNQHWYHCHTCRMLDGVGVCSVCARVCHKGHDLSYAKYGNFFCDCGAKEDGSCQALVKRIQSIDSTGQEYQTNSELNVSSTNRTNSPIFDRIKLREKKHINIKQLTISKDFISSYLTNSQLIKNLIDLVGGLLGPVEVSCKQNSPVGCYWRALEALQQLRSAEKVYQHTDQLMVGTVGSQEGAFENVRMSYAGEQGQTIRQLLSAHIIRRVAMCCMTSTHGRRQHLAVSHEKGKITVLQLSALLKQNDSSTRKLTLSKLGSAPIPFTVLSLASNLCNEDYLAVCGLKDCHILTFTSTGSVSDHLVLVPLLETGNFIIKSIWLPGSQTKLALVTADFVKIYDLAIDALSPQYYFLVPSGKIRDCSFMYENGTYDILLMSSPGHIYTEVLNDDSSAKHGSFYVTNTLEVFHLDVTDVNGQVCGGGVSIYYSHTLSLLFYSYGQGKSFISPITPSNTCLTVVFPITLPPSSAGSKSNGGRSSPLQPLCNWTEIPNHPGLICCAMQSSNNPVILMIKPDTILIQEVKTVPPKTKIMDMVAIRHCSGTSNEQRTTLMLLCEDGSLKMSIANMEQTGFWMSATIQPIVTTPALKTKKKKIVKVGKSVSNSVLFPVDFFEHCTAMNDIEIGGNDLLQIYNLAQLKHRLNANGLYVVCNRPLGFTVEITNNDPNMVIVGLRVLVGGQDAQKAPSFIDIFGRIISLSVSRSRWYDVPFSREESLQADKKISVIFGPSQDPETVTMVDNIKVYGKTKEAFGWPEEQEETTTTTTNQILPQESELPSSLKPLTKLEKLVVGSLEVLDASFLLIDDRQLNFQQPTLSICTKLLTLPTPPLVQIYSKALLAALHSNRTLYYNYLDEALLGHVLTNLRQMTEGEAAEIDAESYYRLVLIVRGIAIARPANLVKFADSNTCIQDITLDDPLEPRTSVKNDPKNQHLLLKLMEVLWLLHELNPENVNLVPVVVPGLKHTEQVIYALIEVVNAFNTCDTYSNITISVYLQLLLCKDPTIAFSAKQALSRVLRSKNRRKKQPPTQPVTPTESIKLNQTFELAAPETSNQEALEALLGAGGGYPPLLDIPPDADDETMVELAIALSLQDHDPGAQAHFSDTTASAGGSDDEGSTAATDGSTLRTSPAEQVAVSGGGSESGGSGVESINNVSGRSSTNGDHQKVQAPEEDTDSGGSGSRLHILRLQLLERLTEYLPKLIKVDGIRAIPFLQVVLQLTTDLDGNCERDRSCFQSLLYAILVALELNLSENTDIGARNSKKEVQLVLMKLLSVFMGRCKAPGSKVNDNSTFIARKTATCLYNAFIISYFNLILERLLPCWQALPVCEENKSLASGNLLKEHSTRSPPDMTPFFLKQYVKDNSDLFGHYQELLTEVALRIPYQVNKYSDEFDSFYSYNDYWYNNLCEYMMLQQASPVRRQVRKLLLLICGNKEKYRFHRDQHALNKHVKGLIECCERGGYQDLLLIHHPLSLPYDILVDLVEHLRACIEIAVNRTGNWQRFCIQKDNIIAYLIQMSCLLDESVAPTILHLLQCAIANVPKKDVPQIAKAGTSRNEREKSDDSNTDALFEEAKSVVLVEQINRCVSNDVFARFVRIFMLETNTTSVRWQSHTLIQAIYKNSKQPEQKIILDLLWSLWPAIPNYGRKASQFVDLLGYFSLKYFEANPDLVEMKSCAEKAVQILKTQNALLSHHPNANLYAHMSQFVELDGYYLESEPCLVCNNPEVNFTVIKLSSLKVDSKFTTTTQIVKLLASHTISKITLRIGDLKRAKMVRTINIYYNNRTVQAVVELKNKPALWHKAKKVNVQSGQTEVKIEFPLPIVACNLMIEYLDFYENIQASSETLQCPRCSAAVPSNPGVCGNCGENVFQCHKCRAINYDEKDPFLCHACGFCKYAKFDFTLFAKPCCAIEPIEHDDDRKKTVGSINSLLEKADRVYKQLIGNKPTLEALVLKISENRNEKKIDEVPPPSNQNHQVKVNKTIQMLAQQYCNECKTNFEELSKIIQRVLVSRKELVSYDRRTSDELPKTDLEAYIPSTKCYGCATAATEHCLTLLRALAANSGTKTILCQNGLIHELVANNLRRGTAQDDVKQLLCVLTRDCQQSTEELCNLLMARIMIHLNNNLNELGMSVRHEISLLAALIQKEDECWELKLKCMLQLFLKACNDSKSPLVMESIILPCLKMLQSIMKPSIDDKQAKKKEKCNNFNELNAPTIDVFQFLGSKTSTHSFNEWKTRVVRKTKYSSTLQAKSKDEQHVEYLVEKYAKRWRIKTTKESSLSSSSLQLDDCAWLKAVLFNTSSRLARQVVCSIIELMCCSSERKKEILILLTCFLEELGTAGENSAEFLTLYQSLIQEVPWRQFLTLQGVLIILADLITMEIEQLHFLEATTLTSDLAQGYALNQLTELLASFLEDGAIRRQYKSKLVGAVLNGYLSLRRLVVQRTRLIDDTQEKLLELLEEMTTGTEEEAKSFMAVCIETVEKHNVHDILTPVFIFERLCSIIYPEENEVDEFFLTLEKDPQQEDFLQGRMLGNPYSSAEIGLGPLMRDVKNKICQDCELVALLEDDNGMELLVNNKIISLDLPVKDVFKKIWVAEGGDHDAMRVVYRMRGLLGDATEEFIETLNNKSQSKVDNEEVYKMANVLADCGGLEVMVRRLAAIQNVWRAKPLLQVLLKLFRLCIKVTKCQVVLIQTKLGAMEVFLRTLQLCLDSEPDAAQPQVTEQLLDIMETVLSRATTESIETFTEFSTTFGSSDYVKSLLTCTMHPSVKNNQLVAINLTRVLAALVYNNTDRMQILMDYFQPILDFNNYDFDHTKDDQQKFEMFCVLTNGIERNAIGNTLKDYIISLKVVENCLEYIIMFAPCVKPTLLRTDSDELKFFISKPSLKYCLRFLTGLAHSHENTQLAIAEAETIPIIHRLEQVSSDEHVGSLAENLLEALCTNQVVAKQIEQVREFTRSEKKRLAMAMREKQLGQLGMRTNDKGQVTAKSTILQQIEELGEETGLVCCICREGYKYQPMKVLGIYTFTKRCNVEEFEVKSRKTVGYTTVSHFNVVHVDCHMSAVRLARARDEWESAALQNANTKCNGLLPLWGPQVPESAFASCLARHNAYLQESTNHRDIAHNSTMHDLKLLLWRFAQEKSFHEDTGGGGPQSNMHMVPYIIHVALYVINTTRSSKREEASLVAYLDCKKWERWCEMAFEAEGPLYWATMSILLHSLVQWEENRLKHLRKLIVLAQIRHLHPSGAVKVLTDRTVKDYGVYRPYLMFFGLIDGIYSVMFKNVSGSGEQWPTNLADYIRYNDEHLMITSEALLNTLVEEMLPCTSFTEFCDVASLLNVIPNPDTFISETLEE